VTQEPPEKSQRPQEANIQEPQDPESSQRVGAPEEDTAAVLLVAAIVIVGAIVLGLLGVNLPG
jgi:hypothetical protein